MTQPRPEFQLTIWPDASVVSVVRRFIEEVYERAALDGDSVGRIAMAAHELLENAVKYGDGGPLHIRIDMSGGESREKIDLCVTSRGHGAHVETLRSTLAELDAAEDPMMHYYTLMRRTSKTNDGSGLGLARIVAEAEMALELACDSDIVRIHARGAVDRRN